jgi:hypothetical protein
MQRSTGRIDITLHREEVGYILLCIMQRCTGKIDITLHHAEEYR